MSHVTKKDIVMWIEASWPDAYPMNQHAEYAAFLKTVQLFVGIPVDPERSAGLDPVGSARGPLASIRNSLSPQAQTPVLLSAAHDVVAPNPMPMDLDDNFPANAVNPAPGVVSQELGAPPAEKPGRFDQQSGRDAADLPPQNERASVRELNPNTAVNMGPNSNSNSNSNLISNSSPNMAGARLSPDVMRQTDFGPNFPTEDAGFDPDDEVGRASCIHADCNMNSAFARTDASHIPNSDPDTILPSIESDWELITGQDIINEHGLNDSVNPRLSNALNRLRMFLLGYQTPKLPEQIYENVTRENDFYELFGILPLPVFDNVLGGIPSEVKSYEEGPNGLCCETVGGEFCLELTGGSVCQSPSHGAWAAFHVCSSCNQWSVHELMRDDNLALTVDTMENMRAYLCDDCAAEVGRDVHKVLKHRITGNLNVWGWCKRFPDPSNIPPWASTIGGGITYKGDAYLSTGCPCATKLTVQRLCRYHRFEYADKLMSQVQKMHEWQQQTYGRKVCFGCLEADQPVKNASESTAWQCLVCGGLTVNQPGMWYMGGPDQLIDPALQPSTSSTRTSQVEEQQVKEEELEEDDKLQTIPEYQQQEEEGRDAEAIPEYQQQQKERRDAKVQTMPEHQPTLSPREDSYSRGSSQGQFARDLSILLRERESKARQYEGEESVGLYNLEPSAGPYANQDEVFRSALSLEDRRRHAEQVRSLSRQQARQQTAINDGGQGEGQDAQQDEEQVGEQVEEQVKEDEGRDQDGDQDGDQDEWKEASWHEIWDIIEHGI
ncbi:hypothetical protein TrVGV298_001451 [Trichoderma virens]|nr:hypothetical protein TrVGV298_001451 [Trichoderma virens]